MKKRILHVFWDLKNSYIRGSSFLGFISDDSSISCFSDLDDEPPELSRKDYNNSITIMFPPHGTVLCYAR